MLKLTLDHNCIINLETHEGQHAALKQLIALHAEGAVALHVGWISASENVRSGEPSSTDFGERIERLNLGRLPRVLPEWRLGVSYIGECIIGGDDDLTARVGEIIHPSLASYEQFAGDQGLDLNDPIHPKWRNRSCDIDALVAHIRHGNDVFVTEDRHFLDHREALVALGADNVLTSADTINFLQKK